MKSSVTEDFRRLLADLPVAQRRQAVRAYAQWRTDPFRPSLQFKRVSPRQPIYSVRIGLHWRALEYRDGDHIYWSWIGPHADYDALLDRQ